MTDTVDGDAQRKKVDGYMVPRGMLQYLFSLTHDAPIFCWSLLSLLFCVCFREHPLELAGAVVASLVYHATMDCPRFNVVDWVRVTER